MKIKELLDEAIFALSDQNYNKSIAYSLLSIATKLNKIILPTDQKAEILML